MIYSLTLIPGRLRQFLSFTDCGYLQVKSLKTAILSLMLISLTAGLSAEDRSSKDIQKDIEARKTEIDALRKEINQAEKQLNSKINESSSVQEILAGLDHKIELTEKLLKSLAREERFASEQIFLIEQELGIKERALIKLQDQMEQRIIHLYQYGRPTLLETVFLSENWNEMIYRIKYLDVLIDYEESISDDISTKMTELKQENDRYNDELLKKQQLRLEKERENSTLAEDKKTRQDYKDKLDLQAGQLRKSLEGKQKMLKELESLVTNLLTDAEAARKREDELVRLRELRQMATTGNFAALKGNLPWPVQGKIVTRYGNQVNPELNTTTFNPGVDILAAANAPVVAVLDGIITKITFIHGFGNVLIIAHGSGYHTVYANIDNILVSEKEYVQSGVQLAQVGGTGTGPRLHFEIYGNSNKLNPEQWLMKK